MNTLSKTEKIREEIKDLVRHTIFSATFIKKNGEVRNIVCRLGVKKDQNGNGLKFDPIKKGLLTVWDIRSKGYKMINLNTIKELRTRGSVVKFEN